MAEMKVVTLENLTYFAQKVDAELETKVDVREGYALSKNDYSDAEKQRVADLETKVNALEVTGGQANVIEVVKVNDTPLTITEKAVNIDLSAYALKSQITSAMYWRGTVATVDELPSGAAQGDIYHVTEKSAEYAWDGSNWEELGSIVDLSAYAKTAEVTEAISNAVAPLATTEALNTAVSTINTEVAKKADQTAVDSTVAEINAAVATKANAADVYTKTEIDGKVTTINEAIALKADSETVNASIAEIEADLALKAVKSEVEAALALKQDTLTAITTDEIDALFASA